MVVVVVMMTVVVVMTVVVMMTVVVRNGKPNVPVHHSYQSYPRCATRTG